VTGRQYTTQRLSCIQAGKLRKVPDDKGLNHVATGPSLFGRNPMSDGIKLHEHRLKINYYKKYTTKTFPAFKNQLKLYLIGNPEH